MRSSFSPPDNQTAFLRDMPSLVLQHMVTPIQTVSEETLKEKHANLTGVAVEVPLHKGKGLGSNCQSSESVSQATAQQAATMKQNWQVLMPILCLHQEGWFSPLFHSR
jgi:hypothetical protein